MYNWLKNHWQPIVGWIIILFVLIPAFFKIVGFGYEIQHLLFGYDWADLWGIFWRLAILFSAIVAASYLPIFGTVLLAKWLLNQKDWGSGLHEEKPVKISHIDWETALGVEKFFPKS